MQVTVQHPAVQLSPLACIWGLTDWQPAAPAQCCRQNNGTSSAGLHQMGQLQLSPLPSVQTRSGWQHWLYLQVHDNWKLYVASELGCQLKLGEYLVLLKIPPEKISSATSLQSLPTQPCLLCWSRIPGVNPVICEANGIAVYLKLDFIFKGLF